MPFRIFSIDSGPKPWSTNPDNSGWWLRVEDTVTGEQFCLDTSAASTHEFGIGEILPSINWNSEGKQFTARDGTVWYKGSVPGINLAGRGGGGGGPRRAASGGGGGRPQPSGGGTASGAVSGAANVSAAPSRTVPTMSQAVAVLKECIDAVAGIGGSDGHATTLFLARLRGDVKRDATPAEKEAAVAAKAAAEAAAKAVEEKRLADEAARAQQQAALGAMPPMPADALGSEDIPFAFAMMAGLGTLLAALSGSGLPGVA